MRQPFSIFTFQFSLHCFDLRGFAEGGIKLMAGVTFFDGEGEAFGLVVGVEGGDMDGIAREEVGFDYLVGQIVLDILLNGTFQWAGTILLVPSFEENEILGFIVNVNIVAHGLDSIEQPL